MTDRISFPPLHGPPPGELEKRKHHLLSEIRCEPKKEPLGLRRFTPPGLPRLSNVRPVFIVPVVLLVALALVPIGGASLGTRAVNGISSFWDSPPNQPALDFAASDAESVAGSAYYTEAVVDDSANTVDVYLASAPQSIIDQLQSLHPGIYVIHNDAAHPLSELRQLENSLPLEALAAEGIDVVRVAPTPEGYLNVGVTSTSSTDVQAAQSAADAAAGAGVVKVYGGAQPGVSAVKILHRLSPSALAHLKRLEHRRAKH